MCMYFFLGLLTVLVIESRECRIVIEDFFTRSYAIYRIFSFLEMGELTSPQVLTHAEIDSEMTLFDCKWIPCSARFVVAGTHPKGYGILRVYSIGGRGDIENPKPGGDIEIKHPFKCVTFGASELEDRHPAVGDFEGNVEIWDLEQGQSVWKVKAHKTIVNSIDGMGGSGVGAPELATGSRDGTVKVWDVRVKDKPVACMQPKSEEVKRDCWSVSMGNSPDANDRMVVAGYDNGDLKMFDLRTMSLHWETHVPNGVCGVSFDRPDIKMNKLAASCLEGKLHVWDLRTKHPKKGYAQWSNAVSGKSGRQTIWAVKFLRQNRDVLATLGGGGAVTLWQYKYPSQRSKKDDNGLDEGVVGELTKLQESQIADQPVSSLDWSPDKTGLAVTTSFDQKIRLVIFTKLNTL